MPGWHGLKTSGGAGRTEARGRTASLSFKSLATTFFVRNFLSGLDTDDSSIAVAATCRRAARVSTSGTRTFHADREEKSKAPRRGGKRDAHVVLAVHRNCVVMRLATGAPGPRAAELLRAPSVLARQIRRGAEGAPHCPEGNSA